MAAARAARWTPPALRRRPLRRAVPSRAPLLVARAAAAEAEEAQEAAAENKDAAGYAKRKEESEEAGVVETRPPRGGDAPPPGSWQWTLNWDPVVYGEGGAPEDVKVVVGSCPMSAADVDRLVDEAGAEAILCLQSGACFDAMGVDIDAVKQRCLERGVLWTSCPVYDFDRLDQAAMLPELTRALARCVALGRRTYVHCTAGINRANLTVLSYLTFVEGWELEPALAHVRSERPQANPYVECWKIARERLLAGREEELYLVTQREGNSKEEGGDWIKRDWEGASRVLIQESFTRWVENDVRTLRTAQALATHAPAAAPPPEPEAEGREEPKRSLFGIRF